MESENRRMLSYRGHSSREPLLSPTALRPKLIYLPPLLGAGFWRPLPTVERTNVEYVFGINVTRLYCNEELFSKKAAGERHVHES